MNHTSFNPLDVLGYGLGLMLALSLTNYANAQVKDSLSLDDAIGIALERNHDIRIAEKNRIVAENNVAIGNANMLPTVDLSAGYQYSSNNTDISFASPDQPGINQSGAISQNYNAGITMNYNVFSGGSKYITYQKLQTQHTAGALRAQQAVENTTFNVASKFLEVVRLWDAYDIQKQSLGISEERYERAREKYNFGSFDKLQLLNAEVDLRNDSIMAMQDSLSLEKAIKDLNALMGIEADSEYALDKELEFAGMPELATLLDEAANQNKSYLLARSNLEISEQDVRIARAGFWPRLDISAGYQYNYSDNQAGFISTQENLGWTAGVTLSYNLFNGGSTRRGVENAIVNREREKINLDKVALEIEKNILNAFHEYQTNLKLLEKSRRNLVLAELNYERSDEAYKTGQITGLELRDAQLNLIQSRNNVSQQKIQAKLSEFTLLFYAGKLVEVDQQQ